MKNVGSFLVVVVCLALGAQCEPRYLGGDCDSPPETGPCRARHLMFFFDQASSQCRQFNYGGCGGNGNRFESRELCQEVCLNHRGVRSNATPDPVCLLSAETGPCRGAFLRYHHAGDGRCQQFTYGGCEGNENNFASMQECLDRCGLSVY